jgi:nucleotide-binding universal stress UspA family protein
MDDWHPEQAARDTQGQALRAEDLDGVTVQTTVVEGEPARVLLDASKEADLLVVGSRGPWRAGRQCCLAA